jgi:hypothetical protein
MCVQNFVLLYYEEAYCFSLPVFLHRYKYVVIFPKRYLGTYNDILGIYPVCPVLYLRDIALAICDT